MAKVENSLIGAAAKVTTFKTLEIRDIAQKILTTHLSGKVYEPSEAANWTQTIANEVGTSLRDLKMERYKHIVQVVIGTLVKFFFEFEFLKISKFFFLIL